MSKLSVFLSKVAYAVTVAIFAPIMTWFMVVLGQIALITLGEIPGILAAGITLGLGLPVLLMGTFKLADECRHEVLKYFEVIQAQA